MERHLFLTGEIGAGKSWAIAAALGGKMTSMGGFRTYRNTDSQGKAVSFSMECAGSGEKGVFLDLSTGIPQVHMEVFETLGLSSLKGERLLLDEIGGIELLSPAFWKGLEEALKSSVPILGVLKGKGASDALAARLGLPEEYHSQTEKLWNLLCQDENTLIFACEKYDEKALNLAKQWVREYCL